MTPRSFTRTRRLVATGAVLALGVSLAACGGDDDDDSADAPAAESPISVSGAWARTSPAMADAGAVYLTLSNSGSDDALVAASVDASVAGKVELHETTMAEGDMSSMDTGAMDSSHSMESMSSDAPMMQMVPVQSITVPADGSVSLEPGGYHIMLLELAAPLELGKTIQVTLDFSDAPDQTIEVPIRDEAP